MIHEINCIHITWGKSSGDAEERIQALEFSEQYAMASSADYLPTNSASIVRLLSGMALRQGGCCCCGCQVWNCPWLSKSVGMTKFNSSQRRIWGSRLKALGVKHLL